MRPQPDIPSALSAAADALERAANGCTDDVLASQTLRPVAQLVRYAARALDRYVPDRLAELERLSSLLTMASGLVGPQQADELSKMSAAALAGSGRTPLTELDALADAACRLLITVQEEFETREDAAARKLVQEIWVEQVTSLQVPAR